MHGGITAPQKINDRSHERNADGSNDESRLPMAERKSEIFWVFAKDNNDKYQWDDEIQDDAVPVFLWCELMIIIHHQQQRGYNRDSDDFPIKVKFLAEEIFHNTFRVERNVLCKPTLRLHRENLAAPLREELIRKIGLVS